MESDLLELASSPPPKRETERVTGTVAIWRFDFEAVLENEILDDGLGTPNSVFEELSDDANSDGESVLEEEEEEEGFTASDVKEEVSDGRLRELDALSGDEEVAEKETKSVAEGLFNTNAVFDGEVFSGEEDVEGDREAVSWGDFKIGWNSWERWKPSFSG